MATQDTEFKPADFPMGKQERAARYSLLALLINAGYYAWALWQHGTWDLASVDARAFGKVLLTAVLIGVAFEALIGQSLRRSKAGEILEDERDRAIRAAGTRNAFAVCVVGLLFLCWQLYIEQHLPQAKQIPEGMMAHLPLVFLFLAYGLKYASAIWLYWRDRT